MTRKTRILFAAATAVCMQMAVAAGPTVDTAAIESVTGLKGDYNKAENVFKISKPRDDVTISVDRWTMPPFMCLTSWAAFTPMAGSTMMMGDTVLFEDGFDFVKGGKLPGLCKPSLTGFEDIWCSRNLTRWRR